MLLKTAHTSLVHSEVLSVDSTLNREQGGSHSITSSHGHISNITSETLGKEQDKGIHNPVAYVSVDLWSVKNMKKRTDWSQQVSL